MFTCVSVFSAQRLPFLYRNPNSPLFYDIQLIHLEHTKSPGPKLNLTLVVGM